MPAKRAAKKASKNAAKKRGPTASKSAKKAAGKSVESAVHREKEGTLRSSNGTKVTSRKQAIAIGLSEARAKGAKIPPNPKK